MKESKLMRVGILPAVRRLMEIGGGIDEEDISATFGKNIADLFDAVDSGLVVRSDDRFYVHPRIVWSLMMGAMN